MTWLDRRQRATFRGIPFYFNSLEDEGGRRLASHEFPGRDGAYSEDLGARPRAFGIEAWVVGDDFDVQLQRLERACDIAGAGILVHPRRGRLQVVCLGWRIREVDQDGGIARLALTFREDQPQASPLSVVDPSASAQGVADAARAQTLAEFLGSLKVVQVAGFVREALDEGFDRVLDGLLKVGVVRSLATGTNFAGKLEQLQLILEAGLGDLGGGSKQPDVAAAAVDEVLEELPDAFDSDTAALDALKALAETEAPKLLGSSSQALDAKTNAEAPVNLLRTLALAKAVELAAQADWSTEAEAQLWRACLAEVIDALLTAAPDAEFDRLRRLRAALVSSVPPRLRRLPQVAQFTPVATLPAAVVQYELAGDVEGVEDLVSRNGLGHPLFAPGGEPLDFLVPAAAQ